MNKDLLIYIKNVGRAEEKLRNLIDMDVFRTLSKHNPDWESELQKEADQLDLARVSLSQIFNIVNEVMDFLKGYNDVYDS